jgi:hypothetical protein
LERLQALIRERSPGGPMDLQRAGLRAYFTGRYDAAASLFEQLARLQPNEGRASFYVACSYASLALLAGEPRGEAAVKAQGAWASAIRLKFKPLEAERAQLSPRVLKLLESGR